MLPTMGVPPPVLEYDRTLFVNRDEEVALITNRTQELSLNQPVRCRTVVFWGYKGTGRTWLLKHLHEMLPGLSGVRAYYLDLDEWAGYQVPKNAVVEISDRIAGQVRVWLDRPIVNSNGEQDSPDDRSTELTVDIRELLNDNVLVLLLDHVYESNWDLLECLEDQILAIAAVQPRVLLIMAGRGRAYPWKTPELRLYVKDYQLQPFDDQALTEQQLEKQKPDAVTRTPEIHDLSQGYPLGNYLLATRPTVAKAMQETVDGLLDGVLPRERSWLEALCVLRTFDEECIPVLVASYLNNPSILKWPYKEVRQIRDRLLQTALLRWNEEAGGWEVDKALRSLLERYLQQTKPKIWRRLHCVAYRLYKGWEQQYPDEQKRWRDEASYHAKCLSDAGYDTDQCLEGRSGGDQQDDYSI